MDIADVLPYHQETTFTMVALLAQLFFPPVFSWKFHHRNIIFCHVSSSTSKSELSPFFDD